MRKETTGSACYVGPIWRGVDYSPTWPTWVVGTPGTQTADSDFANDAFQSFWGDQYNAAPEGDQSAPANNGSNYRGDLKTISDNGFNLVRLYNWDMARGAGAGASSTPLDHINFLNYADSLGLKVVVPVSDYFLGDDQYAWNGQAVANYQFSSAPQNIQDDFTLFIASITDPVTGKIHAAIHSISVGNEGDIGQGLSGATPSNFLARTNWWILNMHQQINGTGAAPNGHSVVNGPTPIILLSATFSNADQGGSNGSWFGCLINGVTQGQQTPNGAAASTFSSAVAGLSVADPLYASYYYNSVNISQVSTVPPFQNSLRQTIKLYDEGASSWPGSQFDVPLLLMEVFAPNRTQGQYDQAAAAVGQFLSLEAYLYEYQGGTQSSKTWLMGYNYFEFNDEQDVKLTGLYQYSAISTDVQTGTTVIDYSPYSFPDMTYPLYTLEATAGPGNKGTLIGKLKSLFTSIIIDLSEATSGRSVTVVAADNTITADSSNTEPVSIACQTGENFTISACSTSGFQSPEITLTIQETAENRYTVTVSNANGWLFDQYFSGNQLILQYFYNPAIPAQNLMVKLPLQSNEPYFPITSSQVNS